MSLNNASRDESKYCSAMFRFVGVVTPSTTHTMTYDRLSGRQRAACRYFPIPRTRCSAYRRCAKYYDVYHVP